MDSSFRIVADRVEHAPLLPRLLMSFVSTCNLLHAEIESGQVHENTVGSAPPRIRAATMESLPNLAANLIRVDFSDGMRGLGYKLSSSKEHRRTMPN